MTKKEKSSFFFNNLLKGLGWLAIILIAFILIKDTNFIKNQDWLHSISENIYLVYSVFLASEVIFGIIPPEIFMIWSLHHGITDVYVINVLVLAFISYWAGMIGYFMGLKFSHTKLFKKLYDKYLAKYVSDFRKYSGFLLIVAAMTPVPYSAICMLVGTINYPRKYFYVITLTRFLRFAILGVIIYQANTI